MVEIIEGAKRGNAECLAKIYAMYKNQIYYFCSKLVENDQERAKELCCETFSCAFERLDTLPQAGQFELWIKNIAAIKCYNYVHKMKPMLFLQEVGDTSEPLFSAVEISSMKEGEYDKARASGVMDRMLDRLNDAQRMTLMLHYFNGLSVTQIAKIMSCSDDIVKQRMTKAAEHMKTTVSALEEKGIRLEAVDFRTVLQLMAACITVPQSVNEKIESIISSIAQVGSDTPSADTDAAYVIDKYVTNAEVSKGALEEATEKFASDAETQKSAQNEKSTMLRNLGEFVGNFGNQSKTGAGETANDSADETTDHAETRIKVQRKKAAAPSFFQKLSSTQQAVALLAVVAILVVVLLCALLPNKKSNPDLASSKKQASAASSVVSSQPKTVIPVYTLKFGSETNSVKTDNGTEVAVAKYEFPEVSITAFPEAQNAINSFFNADKKKVLETYAAEKKQQECLYMYKTQSYGKWKINQNTVTMQAGRVDKTSVNLSKNQVSYTYGNAHEETERLGYCFSSQTGKQLKLSDIMQDINGYLDYAASSITAAAEENQKKGSYALYDSYASTIKSVLKKDSRWYLTDTGITVIFNPDEIVYYTYGVQTFDLPYSAVNQFLKVDYQK